MLTIKNKEKLRYRSVGKLNFYVDRMKEIFDLEPDGMGGFKRINDKYEISITNRTYAISITLDRHAAGFQGNYDYKLHSSTGHALYVNKNEISNIDTFIERLALVSMSNFK